MSLLALANGSLFAGRYRIVRSIAQGGMGAVYEVLHIETDRRRALKVMLPSFLQNEEMRGRFRQEARVTARIESDYIVDVLDAGIDDATQMPFLVMELLIGEELDKRLIRLGRLTPHDVVTYLHQAATALDKTHKASIVHRDLKPGNLFLTEREDGSPRVKLLDFGIAKLVAEGATGPATQLLGTPLYMAPEQFQLGLRVSAAADIFALGMIAFTLLTGKPYWQDEAASAGSVYALIATVMHGPREPGRARAWRRGVELPPTFDAWFAKVTALAPQDRFTSATSAIAALGEVFGIHVAQRTSTFGTSGFYAAPPGLPSATAASETAQAPQHAPPAGRATSPSSHSWSPRSAGPTLPMQNTSTSTDVRSSGSYPTAAPAHTSVGSDSQPVGGRSSSVPFPPVGAAAGSTGAGLANTAPIKGRSSLPIALVAALLGVASVVAVALVVFLRGDLGASDPSAAANPMTPEASAVTPKPQDAPPPAAAPTATSAPVVTVEPAPATPTPAPATPTPAPTATAAAPPSTSSVVAVGPKSSAPPSPTSVKKPTAPGTKPPQAPPKPKFD